MNSWLVILISLSYLATLFLAAHLINKKANTPKNFSWYKWTYALSIPVYCTAWTFYGSVGKAVHDGWEFLTTYIGPILTMPLWWIVIRKMIRICETQRISTLPDLISSRYGKSVSVSILSSLFIILGIIPYISIQLKSITSSYEILVYGNHIGHDLSSIFFDDYAFYLSLILALFIILFVFKSIETTDKHHGMMGAVAIDSVVKLIAFVAVGVYVTYGLFNGFNDLLTQADPKLKEAFLHIPEEGSHNWFFLVLLSMSAILLLPRQFQVTVAENTDESHLKTAGWVFPLYLLLINLFVIPIAMAGQLTLPPSIDPDFYVLAVPLTNSNTGLAMLTFIGGFSAATGMIIVSVIALSMIASNNIFAPIFLKQTDSVRSFARYPLISRKVAVFVILFLAYGYYKIIPDTFSIVSIGLISFAAMIQFVPSVIGALFWKDANKKGAIVGLVSGFVIWGYTLVVPTMVEIGWVPTSLVNDGLLGINSLKPESLFGINLSPIANGTFWSLFINSSLFFSISVLTTQSAKERNFAELFVDIFRQERQHQIVWKGQLLHKELIDISKEILGEKRTYHAVETYENIFEKIQYDSHVSPNFVNYFERLLGGAIGSASARILISSIAKEEEIEFGDVIRLLKETGEMSRLNTRLKVQSIELTRRTKELEVANERLRNIDKEKNDFISTVTHELRTPLTSIKAFVEIIHDNPDLEEQDQFLNTINEEIDRMTRLINEVLDMEKLESGALTLQKQHVLPYQIVEDSLSSMEHLLKSKGIYLTNDFPEELKAQSIIGDEDRLKQVFVNLFSNSVKYANTENPKIEVKADLCETNFKISITDNGKGIKEENLNHVFDKFFQARDQTVKKPKGTGLGLSITKKIIELHDGTIEVSSQWEVGSSFTIKFPIYNRVYV